MKVYVAFQGAEIADIFVNKNDAIYRAWELNGVYNRFDGMTKREAMDLCERMYVERHTLQETL